MLGKGSSVSSLNVPLWQTEHKCGNYPWNPVGLSRLRRFGGAQRPGLRASRAGACIRDWIKTGRVTAYSAWNMVLDTVGKGNDTTRDWAQNALLTVNTSSKTLNLTPAYYVFRHIAQFVDAGREGRRDDRRRRDRVQEPERQSIVTVMYNSGGAKTSIVSAAGKKVSFSMPGTGWATVVLVTVI